MAHQAPTKWTNPCMYMRGLLIDNQGLARCWSAFHSVPDNKHYLDAFPPHGTHLALLAMSARSHFCSPAVPLILRMRWVDELEVTKNKRRANVSLARAPQSPTWLRRSAFALGSNLLGGRGGFPFLWFCFAREHKCLNGHGKEADLIREESEGGGKSGHCRQVETEDTVQGCIARNRGKKVSAAHFWFFSTVFVRNARK